MGEQPPEAKALQLTAGFNPLERIQEVNVNQFSQCNDLCLLCIPGLQLKIRSYPNACTDTTNTQKMYDPWKSNNYRVTV